MEIGLVAGMPTYADRLGVFCQRLDATGRQDAWKASVADYSAGCGETGELVVSPKSRSFAPAIARDRA